MFLLFFRTEKGFPALIIIMKHASPWPKTGADHNWLFNYLSMPYCRNIYFLKTLVAIEAEVLQNLQILNFLSGNNVQMMNRHSLPQSIYT